MISSITLYNAILKEFLLDYTSIPLSLMKMQRLLYLVCEKYLAITGEYILYERFEAWDYGPVLRNIWEKVGIKEENSLSHFLRDRNGKVKIVNELTCSILSKIIEETYIKYKLFNGIELSTICTSINGAWYKAYTNYNLYIDIEDMEEDGRILHTTTDNLYWQ